MEQYILLLKKHSIGLFFALVVGVLSVFPSLFAPLAIGDEYKGIQFLYLNDETTYRARIHEVLDGYIGVASPFLYEYKEAHVAVPSVNEFFYAIPALFLGLSGAVLFAKFFFPALLFFLAYLLVRFLLPEEDEDDSMLPAVAAGLLVTLGFDFVDIPLLKNMIFGVPELHLLVWTRLVNPITGVLLVFSIVILAWRILTTSNRFSFVFLGILLSLTVGYVFTFMISFAIVGLLLLLSLARKEYKKSAFLHRVLYWLFLLMHHIGTI